MKFFNCTVLFAKLFKKNLFKYLGVKIIGALQNFPNVILNYEK